MLDGPCAVFCVQWQPCSWDDSSVAGPLPSLESRVENLAREELVDRAIRVQLEKEKAEQGEGVRNASLAGVSRAMRRAEEALNTEGDPLRAEFLELCTKHEGMLLPELTQQLLKTHWDKLPPVASASDDSTKARDA